MRPLLHSRSNRQPALYDTTEATHAAARGQKSNNQQSQNNAGSSRVASDPSFTPLRSQHHSKDAFSDRRDMDWRQLHEPIVPEGKLPVVNV